MRRVASSRWLLAGASAAVGAALGVGLTQRLGRTPTSATAPVPDGWLPVLPVLPVPAAEGEAEARSRGQSPSARIAKYGFPGLSHVRSRESYLLGYDPRTRTAQWVLERLDGRSSGGGGGGGGADRSRCEFREDGSLHRYHRGTNGDFKRSGFDRGHLAAAANHRHSPSAMSDTFYLSNVVPQNPNLNQNAWNNLEKYCRSLTKFNKNVYVCTGPLFLPRAESDGKMYVKYQVIGKNNIAVPTHMFKVLILEKYNGEIELRSYVMPNQPVDPDTRLDHFLVPIESIERASGLLFVSNIMKQTNNVKVITAGGS
ncbi:endonuclease G, mitochondrial [Callorhinchus milii]|uniref:endonuclease G, mitochondrial n=1 Tax=Callorhinchus milii TaxID=7868 RepID=UPI001C3F804E|nr:endonuclease G, mitochondrial [Callorhinchus milii]